MNKIIINLILVLLKKIKKSKIIIKIKMKLLKMKRIIIKLYLVLFQIIIKKETTKKKSKIKRKIKI
jgi:hypothetical protein